MPPPEAAAPPSAKAFPVRLGAGEDAEVALYAHAFGPSQGVERVEAAVRARLEVRRASDVVIGQ